MCFLFSVSFVFGVFFVSVIASKLLHLWTHFSTVPTSAFILYLPTFFLFDLIAICIARLLLAQTRTPLAWVGCVVGSLLTFLAIGGSSSQLGFYYKTGGELEWRDATSYATSKEGLKVLLTGSWAVLASGAVLLIISCFVHGIFYRIFGALLGSIGDDIASGAFSGWFLRRAAPASTTLSGSRAYTSRFVLVYGYFRGLRFLRRGRYSALKNDIDTDLDTEQSYSMEDGRPSSDNRNHQQRQPLTNDDAEKPPAKRGKILQLVSRIPAWVYKVLISIFIAVTLILRPAKPYDYMTITLPVSLLDVFKSEPDFCAEQRKIIENDWPLPDLLDKTYFREAEGDFYKGWEPTPDSKVAEAYRNRTIDWMPEGPLPRGFFRWDPKRFKNGYYGSLGDAKEALSNKCPAIKERDPYYNPVSDPLKITNLDTDILPTLQEALGDGSVKIKHVMFILMESLRLELWPLQMGSHLHGMLMDINAEKDRESVNEGLSQLSPHIEKITGRSMGFTDNNGEPFEPANFTWHDQAKEGYGGINVNGAYTAATMSTKSYCANHCGAWPMPVEKFDEADTDSYQPCIPQILDLLNRAKDNVSDDDSDFRDLQWKTALFESEVEEYDRQEKFDAKLGFQHIITRKQIESDWRFNKSDVLYHKVNYFAYPEPVLMPYLKEFITNTTANNQRMFMSHFTSTTHHAWDTPKGFPTYDYLPHGNLDNKWHRNLNKYINTIRWHDGWMAQLMQLLDDTGIANETLVVFAGDHGHSFKEDCNQEGTYENPHLSNFRVGLTFRHPHLPRVQYEANATTISILPTILDLLINSGSLNKKDTRIASDIVQDYEGQSLIRPYRKSQNGRRAWNFSVVNSGAGMLGITSADVPYKMVIPLAKVTEYRMVDAVNDPLEENAIASWSAEGIVDEARSKFGDEAAQWASEAVPVGNWWALERQRLWRYHSLS
ncbi:hypothetical protein FALBO_2110 [Fusarium albosuccineum]|uniref:Sulfatase N-terminal domain-containing protein n=1 Tax=Fusarium albosuccineum TaxID=1237068 RepID=A0A8H4PCX0_9HYPO|nr:hypothetical protein FALBO_2110 [Fusarium albosuccineum]